MSLPTARVVPTALLAKGGFRLTTEDLAGPGQPLEANAEPFVSTVIDPQSSALHIAQQLTRASPAHAYELGLTTAAMGYHTAAIEALRDCTARAPDHAPAWRKLAELLRLANDDVEAKAAEAAAERGASAAGKWKMAVGERVPARREKAERKLVEKFQKLPPEEAKAALREHLVANPLDAVAMRLLAQLERMAGDFKTSRTLLERALDLCPDFIRARENYAELLLERHRHAAAGAAQVKRLLAQAPRDPYYRHLHAQAMVQLGNFDDAIDAWASLLRENPAEPLHWLSYAQSLHFMGRREESVQAHRQCLELQPDLGQTYWGLADLKGNYLTAADIAAMRAQLESSTLEPDSRAHMLYALGSALERAGDFSESLAAYAEGAKLFRAGFEQRRKGKERGDTAARLRRMKAVFSRENLASRLVPASATTTLDTPIFVVGLPRAGSTLVEQILASHSQVEGTAELPLIGDIVRSLASSRMLVKADPYPECILDLSQSELAALGARYIESARDYRTTERPWFVDKRPWNWLEAGLIHLILPHAKIIDIRREPMAACFAMFKQVLPIDASFSYDFDDLGRYYNNYVSLMEHWQSVMPGRIHFVQYERLVEDTENEIRRMLAYCGLPFEEGCLRFWETERAVATPSAEQVRRPIFRDALQQWRNFEPWLDPLRHALNLPTEA